METEYNYERFSAKAYDFKKFDGPKAGERFPNFKCRSLDGGDFDFSNLSGKWALIETASLTCPMYVRHVKRMNKLAEQYPEIKFLVLYVREAHPGERTHRHTIIEEKRECARAIQNLFDERRMILVDSLDGDIHRQLGAYPNMLYLLRPDGVIAYRADWTQPGEVQDILKKRSQTVIWSSDRARLKPPSPWVVWKVLLIGGWLALLDFVTNFPALLYHMFLRRAKPMP